MADQTYVRYKTALLLLLLAAVSCMCVGLLVAQLMPRCDVTQQETGTAPSTGDRTGRPDGDVTTTTTNEKTDSTTETLNPKQPTSPDPNIIKESWEKNYRIPQETYALNYALLLHPDLDTGRFSGSVDILISVSDSRNYLVVHSKYLNITETKLLADSQDVTVERAFEYEPNEFWVVRTAENIGPGNFTMKLKFSGSLTDRIVGMYRSVYTNKETGKKRFIATSKFQPTFSRRAFPCFDEPSFKSTFETRLVRPSAEGYIALSNMPVQKEEADKPSPGLTTVHFAKSVPMVTYLACFIVCDFPYKELTTKHGVKFRVYAAPDRLESVLYATEIGANITDYFEDYFNVSYPLPKQDMIAIPDFVSGAMEHWGLITYRETNLLYNAASSSSYNHQRVATVISHELAHQWFGNLVTLDWWDDLWLNEGFASYIEYKGVAQYHADWDMTDQFLTSDIQRVMKLDASLSSHPIVQPVDTPDQITSIFDAISYSKGASVLRMLEGFMGPEEFRAGISNFLRRFSYKNAVTQDLWTELERVSTASLPVTSIMDTWTRQMGFPVLVVQRKKDGTGLLLAQRRFLEDPDAVSDQDSPYNYRWEIPVTYFTENVSEPQQIWFHMKDKWIDLALNVSVGWYKINAEQRGYYRVNYDSDNWRKLSEALVSHPDALKPTDRSSLLSDAFSLAKAGDVKYDVPLGMTSYLSQERHYVPWETAVDQLDNILNLLRFTEVYGDFRKYVLQLVTPHFDRLGWNDVGSHLDKRNRVRLVTLACSVGYSPCLQGAKDRLKTWLNDSESVLAPNIRSLVYHFGLQEINTADAWDTMWQRYLNETNSQERSKLTAGLTAIREPWLLHRYIQLAKDEANVRSQDYFSTLRSIADNPVGNSIVWNFLRSEWSSYLVPRFSLNERYLGFLVPRITKFFSSEQQLKEMKSFFNEFPEAGAGERSRREALETTSSNINWLKNHKKAVQTWLQARPNA